MVDLLIKNGLVIDGGGSAGDGTALGDSDADVVVRLNNNKRLRCESKK